MKGIKKYLFIMAALAAVFGFVACSDDDDDDSGSSSGNAVAVYKCDLGHLAYITTFFKDGAFTQVAKVYNNISNPEEKFGEGTYTGDPSKDGVITLTFSTFNGSNVGLTPMGSILNGEYAIENGQLTIMTMLYTRQ